MRVAQRIAAVGLVAAACGADRPPAERAVLDAAATTYVKLALALGERDSDSLDSYHGPEAWRAQVRAEHASLAQIRASALGLAAALQPPRADDDRRIAHDASDQSRRAFLIRQLQALAARVDVLNGARPAFDDEMRMLFALEPVGAIPAIRPPEARTGPSSGPAAAESGTHGARSPVLMELDRLLPGRGDLSRRYAAFDRQYVVSPDRLGAVLSRAIDGCRAVTRAHVALPPGENVTIAYVPDLPWSAFTRYEGHFTSRISVNTGLSLTVDLALDLACHEAYPGHHAIASWLDSREGARRPEFLVLPLFSPQSALQEAAASLAPELAFPDPDRLAFERDELFPLAGLDAAVAPRYVAVGRLIDKLHVAESAVVRRYIDGGLDFARAAAGLEQNALVTSPDTTLKFVNRFRSYAATYTIGRDRLAPIVGGDWAAYIRAVTDLAQVLPDPPRR